MPLACSPRGWGCPWGPRAGHGIDAGGAAGRGRCPGRALGPASCGRTGHPWSSGGPMPGPVAAWPTQTPGQHRASGPLRTCVCDRCASQCLWDINIQPSHSLNLWLQVAGRTADGAGLALRTSMPAEGTIQAQIAPHSLGLRPRSLSDLAFTALPWALAARCYRVLAPFLVGFLAAPWLQMGQLLSTRPFFPAASQPKASQRPAGCQQRPRQCPANGSRCQADASGVPANGSRVPGKGSRVPAVPDLARDAKDLALGAAGWGAGRIALLSLRHQRGRR